MFILLDTPVIIKIKFSDRSMFVEHEGVGVYKSGRRPEVGATGIDVMGIKAPASY